MLYWKKMEAHNWGLAHLILYLSCLALLYCADSDQSLSLLNFIPDGTVMEVLTNYMALAEGKWFSKVIRVGY